MSEPSSDFGLGCPEVVPLALNEVFPDVLAAAQAGAAWAFERLYGDLAPVVTAYVRMQGAAEADDLVSDVFLGVFAGLKSFSGTEQQFRSWVFTIAHRRLVDERRRLARRRWTPAEDLARFGEPVGGDVEAEALDAIGRRRVYDLCGRLPPDQRAVLLLRIVGDLTVEQVAAVLGKSPGAVKALQRRGLAALRKILEQEARTPARAVERLRG